MHPDRRGSGGEMGGVEEGETIIRMYYMMGEKLVSFKGENRII